MTENEMIELQLQMQSKISLKNKLLDSEIKYITGVDSSYFKINNTEYACCCAITLDRYTHNIIERHYEIDKVTFPYISGLLSFREKDLTLKTLGNMKHRTDIIVFDGNGILHIRKMGIATHVGIILDKMTIGVAKSYYKIGNIENIELGNDVGDISNIVYDNYTYGCALRTHKDWKPVYISCGNNITLDYSLKIIKEFITDKSRVPLITQLADIDTHRVRETYIKNMGIKQYKG